MIDQTSTLISSAGFTSGGLATFGGSALCGFFMGYALRKIIKWLLIGLGVIAGIIFLTIQWMASNGYINGVEWDKLGNDIASYGQHSVTQLDLNNLHGIVHTL
jgi:uncharacterized membrane protein (Fun14 family)